MFCCILFALCKINICNFFEKSTLGLLRKSKHCVILKKCTFVQHSTLVLVAAKSIVVFCGLSMRNGYLNFTTIRPEK